MPPHTMGKVRPRFLKRVNISRIVFTAGAILVFSILALTIFNANMHNNNLARKVIEPLGRFLEERGAQESCGGGDAGRGSDNQTPYYRQYYDIKGDIAEATKLIEQTAEANGYRLTHASPDNREFLGAVGDTYINKWYFDDTSKQSSYEELRRGKVKLAFVIDGAGSHNSCRSGEIVMVGHAQIGFEMQLPEYK